MPIRERTEGRSSQADTLALFSVLWALAAVWHLLGNTLTAPAWAQAVLAVGAGVVLLRPGDPLPLALLAFGGVLTVWEEAPVLGNHWLLAGFVDLAILVAVAVGALRGRFGDRTDVALRLFPAVRLCLLGFYLFAAFAKLNSSFFDPAVSCAALYFRESTDSIGLTRLQLGGAGWLEHAVIFATAATELAIPILLIRRRTRAIGVVVALVFHGLLALDRTHEFFDFSAVLLALFVLFLPPLAGTWIAERMGSIRARLALRHEGLPDWIHLGLAGAVAVVAVLVVIDGLTPDRALDVGWWSWQVYVVAVLGTTLAFLRQHRQPVRGALRPHHMVFLLVPLLVVLNGLTPYLELKTGYGWNMYANLRTVDGESNHLLVRRTVPLTDEQADLVEVLETDDVGLSYYAANDYALTWMQLRAYLSEHEAVRITYRRDNQVVAVRHASDRAELVEPVPAWREKMQLFRAVDLREPERCVPTFGPAR